MHYSALHCSAMYYSTSECSKAPLELCCLPLNSPAHINLSISPTNKSTMSAAHGKCWQLGSVAMFRPEGKVPRIGLASKGSPVKWPPNMKTPYFTWQSMMMIGLPKMSLLPKMRKLSKIGVLVILGALLCCLPGGNAHLGVIDTLSSSFTGPCIYDGAYGKPNSYPFHPYDVFASILKQILCNILESLDDPVFTYSGGSSTTMTPASCLAGQYRS